MVGIEIFTWFSLLGALICSLIVIRTRDLLSGAIILGVGGVFVAWVFFALQAPDLGLVQLIIEVVKMCVLILVVSRTFRYAGQSESLSSRALLAALLGLTYGVFLIVVLPSLTPYGGELSPLASRYATEGAALTGSRNLVTSVLFGFRAYDTIGEISVLFVSILGIGVVLRRRKA